MIVPVTGSTAGPGRRKNSCPQGPHNFLVVQMNTVFTFTQFDKCYSRRKRNTVRTYRGHVYSRLMLSFFSYPVKNAFSHCKNDLGSMEHNPNSCICKLKINLRQTKIYKAIA